MNYIMTDKEQADVFMEGFDFDFELVPYSNRPGKFYRSCNFPNDKITIEVLPIEEMQDYLSEAYEAAEYKDYAGWTCGLFSVKKAPGEYARHGENPNHCELLLWPNKNFLNPDAKPIVGFYSKNRGNPGTWKVS